LFKLFTIISSAVDVYITVDVLVVDLELVVVGASSFLYVWCVRGREGERERGREGP
jgi:hypothetical protein